MSAADPFGFLGAINWDAVDQNLDAVAEVLGVMHAPEHVCGYCTQTAVLNADGLCPACRSREDREAFALEQDARDHAVLYGEVEDALSSVV